jgi:autotransporter-associated beta strand protein
MAASTYTGQWVLNQGTLKLAGGINTIAQNNFLEIGVGATLDLNGNSQWVYGFFSDGALNGTGGTVTSSSGTATLVVNNDSARNFAGNITGAVNFVKSGVNTTSLYSLSNYTGTTTINGGGLTLRDSAALTQTSAINVTYATLTLDNTGFNDRMADSMWEWFDDSSINAPAAEIHKMVGQMVTTNQMDPIEVVNRLVELVEAETTTENNFVPENIRELLNL